MIRFPRIKALSGAALCLVIAGCAVTQDDVNRSYDAAHRAAADAMANAT